MKCANNDGGSCSPKNSRRARGCYSLASPESKFKSRNYRICLSIRSWNGAGPELLLQAAADTVGGAAGTLVGAREGFDVDDFHITPLGTGGRSIVARWQFHEISFRYARSENPRMEFRTSDLDRK